MQEILYHSPSLYLNEESFLQPDNNSVFHFHKKKRMLIDQHFETDIVHAVFDCFIRTEAS